MKVYLVILEDHHTDVDVRVFSEKELAVAEFDEIVADYEERYGVTEQEDECPDNWIANHHLSVENDYVRVEEKEVDEGYEEE